MIDSGFKVKRTHTWAVRGNNIQNDGSEYADKDKLRRERPQHPKQVCSDKEENSIYSGRTMKCCGSDPEAFE